MLEILFLVAAAVLYYRIGEHDYGAGFTTAALSLGLGFTTMLLLGWGRVGFFGGQLALFAGLTWYNLRRQKMGPGRMVFFDGPQYTSLRVALMAGVWLVVLLVPLLAWLWRR